MLLYYAVSMNFAQYLSKHGLFICEKLKLNFIIIDHMVLFLCAAELGKQMIKVSRCEYFSRKEDDKKVF